jgi:hypothetical protein
MMRSISLFFLLSAVVQLSAAVQNTPGDFMFYMNTAGDDASHCDHDFATLGIPLDATLDPALAGYLVSPTGATVADAIDAVLGVCSGYGDRVHRKTPPGHEVRNLRAAEATSRKLLLRDCSTSCGCAKSFACQLGGYCDDVCPETGCTCTRRLEDHVQTQRELAQLAQSDIIINDCKGALTSLAVKLGNEGNDCLGMGEFLGFYCHIFN